jgi:AcrR family transcriptional regulator
VTTATARRPYHHGNLRSELLERAEQTLRERGPRELSLRELARDIGVSHAAPRRHFSDKQALIDALAEDGFERLRNEVEAAIDGAGPDFNARLAAFARAYVGFATRHAALLELMFAGKHRPGAADSLREAADRAFAAPLDLVVEAQAAREIVAGDPLRVSIVAFAALHGIAALVNADMLDAGSTDELVSEGVERLTEGLRPR